MRRAAAVLSVMAALLFGSAQAQEAPHAFTDVRVASRAAPAQRERIRLIQAEPVSAAVHIARVSTGVLRAARVGRTVRFQVSPDAVVEARALRTRTEDGRFIWTGEVLSRSRDRPPDLASIIVSGGDVIGWMRASDGRLYSLRPLGALEIAVVEINEAAFPPDHPADAPSPRSREVARSSPEAAAWRAAFYRQLEERQVLQRWATTASELNFAENYTLIPQFWDLPVEAPEITVLVAYTSAAQALHGNIPLLAADVVEQANLIHFNSKVFARLRLVGTMQVNYQELEIDWLYIGAHTHLVDGLNGLDSVHAQRDALAADLVVLIVSHDANVCGNAGPDVGVDAEAAFAVVRYSCAADHSTFAHEIGHLMGARHDMASEPMLTPYAWGHGYRVCESFGTIMAVYCSLTTPPEPPRQLYWSSPLTTWKGVPMGSADLEDVHRVWNERAFDVALFR
jgi:hypothetical protein